MKIVVFGAHGSTGRRTTEQALAAGHFVTAVTRRPDGFPLTHPALRVAVADVLDPDAVDRAVAGQDAVVSALGVPFGRRPVTVYSTGLAHITRAMTGHGVSRLVAVTSTFLFGTEAPGEGLFFRKVMEPLVTRVLGRTVYADMRRMEDAVRHSGLAWTVLRPGGLFDTDTVSDYRLATRRLPGRYTSRADLAHALLRHATGEAHVHAFVDVRTTENTPGMLDLLRKEALRK
ncbi:NAD(P)-dependent oxidoreductase [Streptomyces glaucescens]|uniref:NmrA family protein n=1 Tax=Streptomyces glaucescens TaxID=1907 RepID=A0A089XKD9_STRGA|nr:NAD(P)H-binding protein [Streptomyces glaucescens]AIS01675.1 NmrA family protein [Streptomyces glaucescens]